MADLSIGSVDLATRTYPLATGVFDAVVTEVLVDFGVAAISFELLFF